MRPKLLCTATQIKRPSTGAIVIYIDTDPRRAVFDEPLREMPEQRGGNAGTAMPFGDVKVLHLALATVAASKVTGDVTCQSTVNSSQISRSRSQCMPRMMPALEIRGHSGICGTSVRIGIP